MALREDVRRADAAEEHQERRVVTVLFADLAGSTALGERLDPEDVRELQGGLFELVNSEVERFGGTLEKFVGDAVLAVFGIPQTHEDDPERAVRAALAVRDGFGAFAGHVRDRFGADVGLRIGVNTGEVVAGREAAARGELMVSGDAVNVAARLQQHAETGEILVGERTHAATSRTITYRGRGGIEAKGKQAPVGAWIAVEADAQPAGRGVASLSAPLVGRDEELAVLTAVTNRVSRERAPQLVTLFGQAGVGKSRLLAELVDSVSGARLLTGRCLPYGDGITYWPLAEAAKAEARVLDTDTADVAVSKLRSAVERVVPTGQAERVLEAVAWTIGFSLPGISAVGTDPWEVVRRLQDGWDRYVTALGRERLTILAIEDAHWASTALLDLIEGLAEGLADTCVLLVCTARLELLESHPTWGAGKQNATTLSLGPLTADEAAELVSSLLGESRMPENVRDHVLASAEGNPFFLEEMLHMLIEEGALERRNGGWGATERFAEVSIPDSIHGVIAARIDLLDADARGALRRCSVVGRTFWPAAVGVDEHVIASLGRRGLVADSPDSVMAGMREFAFKHALTRDVAYASLPRPERRLLHRRVAEWIQEVAPDRGVETAELAAYHYGQALVYGEDDPAVPRRAFELLMTAGDAALGRAAFETASAHVLRALELASDEFQQAVAQLALARLDVLEGRSESALERLDVIEELQYGEDPGLRSDALGWRSRASWISGHWEEAFASAQGAVDALAGLPESQQLARALARRSQIEMLTSRPEAIEHAQEALDVARRVGEPFAEVNARINLITSRAMTGIGPDPDELLQVVAAAVETGAYEEAFRAIVNFVWSSTGFVAADQVESMAAEARVLLGGVTPPELLEPYLHVSMAALLLVPAGRWAAADLIARETEEHLSQVTIRLVWLGLTGGLALRRGDLDVAGERVDELRPLAFESDEPQRIVPMAAVALPLALVAGERERLRATAEEVLAVVDGRWSGVLSATPMVRALAEAGELELLTATTESIRRSPGNWSAGSLHTTLLVAEGRLALADGRQDAAVEHLTEAAALERRLGYVYGAACLELDLARALDAVGDAAGAGDVRTRAASVLEPLRCVHPY